MVAAWGLAVVVSVLAMVLAAGLVRAPVREVGLFAGPRLLQVRIRGVSWRVGAVPWGGWVALGRGLDLGGLPAAPALTLAAAGPLALVGLAGLLLGTAPAVEEVRRGFGGLLLGAVMPRVHGAPLLIAWHRLAAEGGFGPLLGVTAAKLAALNLLPLPGLGGSTLLGVLGRRLPWPGGWRERGTTLGFGLALALLAGWVLALIFAVLVPPG